MVTRVLPKTPTDGRCPGCPSSSGRCWRNVPPSATVSSCAPRQIPSTGRSRSRAAARSRRSCSSRSGRVMTVSGCGSAPYDDGVMSAPPISIRPSRASTTCLVRAHRGQQHRSPARPRHRVEVDPAHDRRGSGPRSPGGLFEIGGQADARASGRSETLEATRTLPVRHGSVEGVELDPRRVDVVVDHLVTEDLAGQLRLAELVGRGAQGVRDVRHVGVVGISLEGAVRGAARSRRRGAPPRSARTPRGRG